ncbi:MAG: DUF1570 domain-containing protein [Lentisphaeraceae bacterium]|nr:DUF1570 domain-containing protein [Lentisphaeraceae bacterium]
MQKAIFISLLLFTFVAWGRTPSELTLERSSIKMEAEGIEFKPFRDMQPEQIKPLRSYSFRKSGGGTSASDDQPIVTYNFTELWKRSQKVATYFSNHARVEFYKLNHLPPTGMEKINGEFVRQSDYDEKIVPGKGDLPFITEWFKAFTGKDIKLIDKFPKLTFAFKQKWVEMSQSGNQYDFLIQTRDKRLLYLHAKFTTGTEEETLEALQYFIRQIRIGRPKEVKSSNQSTRVKPIGKVSSAYEETIKKVIQAVANTEGWWYAQTPNYVLKSNLPSKSKTFAKRVQERVELMRKVYEKFIPPVDEISAVSVITIPATRDEYVQYSGAPSWSAGVWNSSRRELVVSQLDGGKKSAEAQMMNVLHHEAFHQYIFYALNNTSPPAWFNEGHADLFAAVKVTGSKVKSIEDGYHMRTLASVFRSRQINIEQFVQYTYDQFYDERQRSINYAFAWSLIYFIRKAEPEYKDKGYDKILGKCLTELTKSRDMFKATKVAFEGVDMNTFQKDFYDFWNDKRARSKAERNVIIPRL